jgi:hypothetical protein
MTFRPVVRNPLLATSKGANTAVFQRPEAAGAESPRTVDEALCIFGARNIGGWYLSRIKRTPGAKCTITGIYANFGTNNSGAAVDAAISIYQLVREDGWPRLRRVKYFPYNVPNGTAFGLKPFQDMFDETLVLDPEKHYAMSFWVGAAACAVIDITYFSPDATVLAGSGGGIYGRAYDASISSDQPLLKVQTTDPSPAYRISNSADMVPHASFYTSEVDFFMF